MKRNLLYLLILSLLTANFAYGQYVEDTLTVNRADEAPYIDGYMDPGEWDTEKFYTITEYGLDEYDEPQMPLPEDFIAKYKMLWDDEYIYFLGVIVDDTLADKKMLTSSAAPTWETDSWEFYIAPTLSKLPSMEEMTQIRWSYANVNQDDACEGVVNGWSSGGFMVDNFGFAARTMTDSGWILEASFALAPFAAVVDEGVLEEGSLIGWQITVSDSDGDALREWIGSWIPDTQWDEADTLGILKLGSDLTGTVGIDKNKVARKISCYPNPVSEVLHIRGGADISTVEIYNTLGAMVLRKSARVDRIDVADLRAGLYFVKAYTSDGFNETLKFLKE